MNILQTSNLQFAKIIDYPDIGIPMNKVTFICGESGCGKSSLLQLFNATVSASKGNVFYIGENIDNMDTIALRKEVVLASQSVFLFDGTIEENFKAYYEFRDELIISKDKMKEYLDLCCADFSLDTKCDTMSGGEKQRVFISIFLSFMPKVLMLDEPSAALDKKTANQFFSQIKDFCSKNNITSIVVSHDKDLVEKYADYVVMLEKRTML